MRAVPVEEGEEGDEGEGQGGEGGKGEKWGESVYVGVEMM